MPFLLAPLFAQLITIGVQDRTETRHVALNDRHYEAQTSPGAKLTLSWKHSDLALRYGASLLVLPLESRSRDLLVYHTGGFDWTYRLRRTTFTFTDTTSYGELNFQTLALNNPAAAAEQPADDPGAEPAPTPTPTDQPPGTVRQVKLLNRTIRNVTSVTSVNVTHKATRQLQFGGGATYSLSGAAQRAERRDYPLVTSLSFNLVGAHTTRLSTHDSLVLNANLLDTWASNNNHATTASLVDTWQHAFNRRSFSYLGGGMSMLRLSQDTGLIAYTILPTALAGLGHNERLARGTLALQLGVFSAPVPDQLRGTVDPRVGGNAGLAWTRDRFRTALAGNATASLAERGNDAGAFDGYAASSVTAYQFRDWVSAELGGRLAKQVFQRQTLLPLSYSVFVALTFGYDWKLGGRH
ncbi:MAG TPA: hypothetical protein VHP33_31840 [Polyangiaceae bacterium]|nr:hypothetical protein [Polyangiaceae bacterium]